MRLCFSHHVRGVLFASVYPPRFPGNGSCLSLVPFSPSWAVNPWVLFSFLLKSTSYAFVIAVSSAFCQLWTFTFVYGVFLQRFFFFNPWGSSLCFFFSLLGVYVLLRDLLPSKNQKNKKKSLRFSPGAFMVSFLGIEVANPPECIWA